MTKSRIFASLLLAGLPWLMTAQSNDDLYFIPKKQTEEKKEVKIQTGKTATVQKQTQASPSSIAPTSVVVKDASGKTRDIDEYNRRYTSRDNTFTMQNDTLYIEEKPVSERGEWVNGFEGSQSDYEYAMRIVRFRSPAYAIPISSPLYWDVVYGVFPSWDWNVYDDGLYAYVFPTYTNPLWWDWRWNWGIAGPRWSWRWYSPWYYGWHSPYWYGSYWGGWYGGWYAGYWGGWYGGYWGHPHYAWGGWHRPGHTDLRPGRYHTAGSSVTRRPNSPSGYRNQSGVAAGNRGASSVRRSSIGRVVESSGTRGTTQSVRPGRTAIRGEGTTGTRTNSRTQGVYTRPSRGADRSGSTYNRPSSTRRSVNYGNRSNSYNSNTRSSYQNSRSGSFNRSSGSSFNRGSTGGGSRSGGRSSGGGGGRRR